MTACCSSKLTAFHVMLDMTACCSSKLTALNVNEIYFLIAWLLLILMLLKINTSFQKQSWIRFKLG